MQRPKIALEKPGVYFFRDKRGRILYIGKAANLRNRLKSYFDSRPKEPRIAKMISESARVSWQETGSEIEALILESQLIKRHKPPFNIMLRDDKQYFYVGFTDEEFPRIFLTHQIQDTKYKILNTKFAGPFTDGNALKTVLRLLRRTFPYCTCKQKHNNYCLNYHIGKCPGFCCLKKGGNKEQAGAYQKNIRAIKEVLSGKRLSIEKGLTKEMEKAAGKENFEKAIVAREQLAKLERVFENARLIRQLEAKDNVLKELKKALRLKILPRRIEGYDISNIQGEFATGAMVVFTNGRPDKNEYRKFKIRLAGKPDDSAMLKEVLTRRFRHSEWPYPDLILVDGGKAQLGTARLAAPKQTPVIALTKNDRHRGDHIYVSNKKEPIRLKDLPVSVRNLILQVDAEAHRFAISYYRKLHRRLS